MKSRVIAAIAVLVLAHTAHADPYAVGSAVPAIELSDQHGKPRVLDASLRAVVFSRDMDAGDVVKAAVAKAGPDLFERNAAVYIVDVKGMPAVIRAMFAMPAMRRRPYQVLVDEDGANTADFPGGVTHPTVLVLDGLRVVEVKQPENADALIAVLEPAAAKTEE